MMNIDISPTLSPSFPPSFPPSSFDPFSASCSQYHHHNTNNNNNHNGDFYSMSSGPSHPFPSSSSFFPSSSPSSFPSSSSSSPSPFFPSSSPSSFSSPFSSSPAYSCNSTSTSHRQKRSFPTPSTTTSSPFSSHNDEEWKEGGVEEEEVAARAKHFKQDHAHSQSSPPLSFSSPTPSHSRKRLLPTSSSSLSSSSSSSSSLHDNDDIIEIPRHSLHPSSVHPYDVNGDAVNIDDYFHHNHHHKKNGMNKFSIQDEGNGHGQEEDILSDNDSDGQRHKYHKYKHHSSSLHIEPLDSPTSPTESFSFFADRNSYRSSPSFERPRNEKVSLSSSSSRPSTSLIPISSLTSVLPFPYHSSSIKSLYDSHRTMMAAERGMREAGNESREREGGKEKQMILYDGRGGNNNNQNVKYIQYFPSSTNRSSLYPVDCSSPDEMSTYVVEEIDDSPITSSTPSPSHASHHHKDGDVALPLPMEYDENEDGDRDMDMDMEMTG